MYGWRARIGMVFPSRGDSFIYEFYKVVPEGVVLVPAIVGLFNLTKQELGAAILQYRAATRDLAQVGVNTIALTGSPVFQLQGFGSDVEMIREVGYCSGIENYSRQAMSRPIVGGGCIISSRNDCRLDWFR